MWCVSTPAIRSFDGTGTAGRRRLTGVLFVHHPPLSGRCDRVHADLHHWSSAQASVSTSHSR